MSRSESMKIFRQNHPPVNKTHGMGKTLIYAVWNTMKKRCTNKLSHDYSNYGGRGINYDSSWEYFENFLKDMGGSYKKGLTLDRIDNNKGYSKDNCRWATYKEQANNKRNNSLLVFMGISDTITNWTIFFGFAETTIFSRIHKYRWSTEKALTENNPYLRRK